MSAYKTLFILICFLLLGDTYGQQADNQYRVDSLEQLLRERSTLDSNRVDILNSLGFEYWIIDPTKSEVYGTQALELSNILKYKEGTAYADRVIGVSHWARGERDKAFKFLLDALNGYSALGDTIGIAGSRLNLGLVYHDQQRYADANRYYKDALVLFEELGEMRRVATAYTKMADNYIALLQLDTAYTYLIKALEIYEDYEYPYGISEVNGKLGELFSVRKEYSQAISHFLIAVEFSKKRQDQVGLASYYHQIADAYYHKREFNLAIDYLKQSEQLADTYDLKQTKRAIYELYKNIEVARGNPSAAISYYDLFLSAKDSLFNEEISNIISAMDSEHRSREDAQALKLAESNLELLKQKSKTDRYAKLFLLFAIVSILAIAWGIQQRLRKSLRNKDEALVDERKKTDALQDQITTKEQELTSYTLNFIQKNEKIAGLESDVKALQDDLGGAHSKALQKIRRNMAGILRADEDWNAFRMHFENVHPTLMSSLYQQFPTLTKNEFRLIALIRLNLSSKEISSVLGISPDSVKTARYRLRKKLSLETSQDLFEYLIAFEAQK